jgi:hypothetical protein
MFLNFRNPLRKSIAFSNSQIMQLNKSAILFLVDINKNKREAVSINNQLNFLFKGIGWFLHE